MPRDLVHFGAVEMSSRPNLFGQMAWRFESLYSGRDLPPGGTSYAELDNTPFLNGSVDFHPYSAPSSRRCSSGYREYVLGIVASFSFSTPPLNPINANHPDAVFGGHTLAKMPHHVPWAEANTAVFLSPREIVVPVIAYLIGALSVSRNRSVFVGLRRGDVVERSAGAST
jgi:hypothetical protein